MGIVDYKEITLISSTTFLLILVIFYIHSWVTLFFFVMISLVLYLCIRLIQLRNYDSNLEFKKDKDLIEVDKLTKFCFNCNMAYSYDMVFCQNCGLRL